MTDGEARARGGCLCGVSITAGTIDPPTRLRITEHIYVGSKSDHYEIGDGLPQKSEWSE